MAVLERSPLLCLPCAPVLLAPCASAGCVVLSVIYLASFTPALGARAPPDCGSQRERGLVRRHIMTSKTFQSLLPRLVGLKTLLVCDAEGAILLRAGDSGSELRLQRLSATFAQTTEHTGKLGLGKNRHITAFYEDAIIVHASCLPLVLSLMVDADANVGLILDELPQLVAALAPLQQHVERLNTQSGRD